MVPKNNGGFMLKIKEQEKKLTMATVELGQYHGLNLILFSMSMTYYYNLVIPISSYHTSYKNTVYCMILVLYNIKHFIMGNELHNMDNLGQVTLVAKCSRTLLFGFGWIVIIYSSIRS